MYKCEVNLKNVIKVVLTFLSVTAPAKRGPMNPVMFANMVVIPIRVPA
jgi:hypothetical protein